MTNRTIKFRVRHVASGKIIAYEMLMASDPANKNYEWASSGDGKNWVGGLSGIVIGPGVQREQFTGDFDYNGKEIYEKDIVKNDAYSLVKWPLEVRWEDGLGWVFGRSWPFIAAHDIGNINQIEVIGNIYQNPELLK